MNNKYLTHMETNQGITVFLEDKVFSILKDNPKHDLVKALIDEGNEDEIPGVLDIDARIKRHSKGKFWVDSESGRIVIDNEKLPDSLSERLIQFVENNLLSVVERFKARNEENCRRSKDTFVINTYSGYNRTLDREGHLYGLHDTWASDFFAFAFNSSPIPRALYEEFYERMFGVRLR